MASPNAETGARAGRGIRPAYLAALACAVVSGCLAVAAVVATPDGFRVTSAIGAAGAAVVLCVAVAAAVHFRVLAAEYRAAAARADEVIVTAHAEAAARVAAAEEAAEKHAREAKRSDARRAAALAAFAGAAGRMQALSTSMLAELREMEHRHADPRVLADLLQLDHRTAQAGRLADSIAVLSGARTGRRWAKPIAMESILRGAMGRVAGYQRIRLRAVAGVGIAGHAAEGIMHALAELLDNACNFSPPTTEVHVYATEVPAGVVITLEDSGLVMSESALRRAERAVSGADAEGRGGVDLSSLSGTRLGLAVVGHLARKHGLTVSYRPSAIGGTAVVVIVPRDLVTRVDRAASPATTNRHLPIHQPGKALRDNASAAGADMDTATLRTVSVDVLPQNDLPRRRPEGSAASSTAAPDPSDSGTAATGAGAQDLSTAARDAGRDVSEGGSDGAVAETTRAEGSGPRLPKRRRGDTLAAAHPGGLPKAGEGTKSEGAEWKPASSARSSALGAFQRAVSGRDSAAEIPSVALENDL
ncbi:sensor histidine kinase [Nocardia blacklockiae]|uniref:sensor histidine kinase n=1 Tax=Nocardia blacklockiae TaxID=480036 RepID=UPI0018963BF5|nr:ATP-binding protein [Nocardia blacklockiae]MBF6175854.1 sensor histidine kinase [Nocardia blacklockiae]